MGIIMITMFGEISGSQNGNYEDNSFGMLCHVDW